MILTLSHTHLALECYAETTVVSSVQRVFGCFPHYGLMDIYAYTHIGVMGMSLNLTEVGRGEYI